MKMARGLLLEFSERKPYLRITEMNNVSMSLKNCTYITQQLHFKVCICLRGHFKTEELVYGYEAGHLEGSHL